MDNINRTEKSIISKTTYKIRLISQTYLVRQSCRSLISAEKQRKIVPLLK